MARTIDELQEILSNVPGVKKAYYQPPESVKLVYPCIIYSMNGIRSNHADDIIYKSKKRYSVIVIDKDSESTIGDYIMENVPYVGFDRMYTSDNLYHYTYTLFF